MGCGTNTVPGFKEFDTQYKKDVKDPALEMKMNQLLIKAEKKTKKKQT
mgnify:CR=1 FL=1